jgi:hypothetical protein
MVVPPRAATPGQAAAVGTTAIEPVRGTAIPLSGRTNAIAHASALNANARVAPTDIVSEELQKFFNSYGALIITASLSALVAAALPGIAAFLLPTLAGMGFGYRQARAGLKVRASGIARFAGSGPVGIVRSGSQISLRSGAQRVPRPARAESGRRSERDSHFAA